MALFVIEILPDETTCMTLDSGYFYSIVNKSLWRRKDVNVLTVNGRNFVCDVELELLILLCTMRN